jgi:2-keto-4-pentenoate hydratase
MSAIQDRRVQAGLDQQFSALKRAVRSGSKVLGWKVGFGSHPAMAKLQISSPLIGNLLRENSLQSGAACRLVGWTKPVAEPEIAVYLNADLPPGSSEDVVARSVGALGPAIELADLVFAPEDPERILAENIYHRNVLLGPPDSSRAGARLDGLAGRLTVDGVAAAPVTDLEANTGRIISIVKHVADTLGTMKETLRKGQIVIAGSVIAPIFLAPQNREVLFEFSPTHQVRVRFEYQ